ncbi:pentapeptide repeat-containing protein [Leekyejoonella antrihumi]|nr:pentapeptide repeat-containing protein [Leekyejoonella antrihumi]
MQRSVRVRRGRSSATLSMLACIIALIVSTLMIFSSPANAVVTLKQSASVTQDVAGPAKKHNAGVAQGVAGTANQHNGPADPSTKVFGAAFASWLLDKAGGATAAQGVGMIFSLSGLNRVLSPDPNTVLLREILRQLTQIQGDIRDLRRSLDGLINQLSRDNLDRLLVQLRDTVTTPLDHLFREEFARVVSAAEAYANAREHDPVQITPTYDALIQRRNEFYMAFDRCCTTATAQIHHFLVPGPSSVLAAMGRVLAGEHRYLTAADSADLRNLHNQFADWEALAAWMKMERLLPSVDPSRVPAGVFPGDLAAYNQARRDFLGYRRSEAQNLVPAIPRDVVIDGSTAGSTTTLTGARMYVPASTGLTYQPAVDRAGSVPRAVTELNARHAEGLNHWRVPSQAELTQLLTGRPTQPPTTGVDFLRSLNPTSRAWGQIVGGSWPFLWSSDEVTRTTWCWVYDGRGSPVLDQYHPVRTHTAVSIATANPAWTARPLVPHRPTDPQACVALIASQFAANTGALLATRTVGAMPIDYLGRGGGPTLRPSAHLRNADLSGLDLTGTNLTDADLTGATLTGAYFTDDEGATGVNLTRARLAGVTSGGIVGDATLPTGWQLTNGYLVGPQANLTDADLRGADLSGADLRGVTSGGVDCTGCKLPVGWHWTGLKSGGFLVGPGADLRGADLQGLDLSGVDLTGAQLAGANLTHANLSRAVLSDLSLAGVRLTGSNLTGAELSRSTISGVGFAGATLTGVRSFSLVDTPVPATLPSPWRVRAGSLFGPGANLSGLAFIGADLRGIKATGADFTGANLTFANLTGVDLTGASFTGANLTNLNLTNAILVNARLTQATVTGATFTTDSDNTFAGIVSGGLVGTPASLPASGRYRLVQGYLVGPSANLAGATFTSAAQLGASLSGTNFTGATLSGVNLTGAALRNAILTGARLTGATLSGADLSHAMLDGVSSGGIVGTPSLPIRWTVNGGYLVGPRANLRDANLSGAHFLFRDLRATDLHGANLTDAHLGAANLDGADLTGAVLTGVQWGVTMCPDGVRRVGATPCAAAVWRGSSTTSASANKSAGTLIVDVGPGLPDGALWEVIVQRLSDSGGWVTLSTHTTKGPGNPLRLNLPAGTYRAITWPQKNYHGSASQSIGLVK